MYDYSTTANVTYYRVLDSKDEFSCGKELKKRNKKEKSPEAEE